MSIIDTLAKDHRALEQALTGLGGTTGRDGKVRLAQFTKLQALLQAHARAEEEVVYRRLREALPDEEITLEAFEEHHVADILLQELASACPGGKGWAAKLKVLEEVVRMHIKEEELKMFPLIQENLSEPAQALMAQDFELLKHERIEELLGPIRRATPAFAGRASITAQAAAGRYLRRGELYVRHAISQLRA